MSNKFITNTSKIDSLADLVQNYSKSSSRLDFLVGYFFFSGFCEIADGIKDVPLRILVGMDADTDVNNCIFEYTNYGKDDASKKQIKDKYFSSLKKIINTADTLDTETFEKSFRIFIEKLENGTLEVRKTDSPNHAKMYLFCVDKSTPSGRDESCVIVGSSNFSIQGLKRRNEVNVWLKDENDYVDGKKIFDSLWKTAVPLVSKENTDEFRTLVLKKTWLETFPEPYLLYVRVLYEYFKIADSFIKTPFELTRGSQLEYSDISYQIDAIREGLEKLKKHSGLIVADVVGLGKSIIASCIAANIDRRVVVVSPPHLKEQWEDYAMSFRLSGCKVYSSGKIEDAVKENDGNAPLTVIIDEAHRYKNEDTEDYALLHKLCAGNYVILLSATPFNNRPSDIFSLIKLFEIPTNSTIQTVDNLSEKMSELAIKYKKLQDKHRKKDDTVDEFTRNSENIALEIRNVLDPVVIRRTRVDLEKTEKYKLDLEKQHIKFSFVNDPKIQHYDLGEISELYLDTLEKLKGDENGFGFIGTRYKPLIYLNAENGKIDEKLIKKYSQYFNIENFTTGQKNMADFMRQMLVRRFESSKYSFVKSLKSILTSMKQTKKYFETYKMIPMDKKRRFPDIDELESNYGDDPDEILKHQDEIIADINQKLNEKDIWKIDADDISEDFLSDLEKDIELVGGFIEEWEKVIDDPKLDAIIKTIKASIENDKKRKIIIFSEFSDTVEYLFDAFKNNGIKAMCYTSKNASKNLQRQVRYNFDAGVAKSEQKDDFDVLIATDAISEGFSLHRAGTIYNYDIPYNPTRVIQRVGRINRINKKVFDELYIYNFFPSDIGENVSHTKEISTFKMRLFQAILGSDTKILTENEFIQGYGSKDVSEDSWEAEFRNELYQIEKNEKETLEKAVALPYRCRIGRKLDFSTDAQVAPTVLPSFAKQNSRDKGLVMFSKKGDSYRFCFVNETGGTSLLSAEMALKMFQAKKDEKPLKTTDVFYKLYERAKTESGNVKVAVPVQENTQKAIAEVRFLQQQQKDDDYVDALLKVLESDALPEFVTRKITEICKSNGGSLAYPAGAVEMLKTEISEKYIDTLLSKIKMIGKEPQTILVAEEFV